MFLGGFMKVVVIGGGASGIVASIFAKKSNNEVIVLEKNSKCLKKLLITGNGKCNYFNDDFSIEHYYSKSIDFLSNIVNEDNKNMVLDFMSNIGVVPRIKNGYYYPYSNQAYTVFNALLKEASLRGVDIRNNVNVLNIVRNDAGFIVYTDNGNYSCDKVIISTGGKSYPKTGSEGDGYIFGERLGHSIVFIRPSLVGLVSNSKFLKDLSGVRCDATVSIYIDNVLCKSQVGEVQFTDYGLSGICIFNLSNVINKIDSNIYVSVNFLDGVVSDFSSFVNLFDKRNNSIKGRTIVELLEGYLNYKIVNVILKFCGISYDALWNSIDDLSRRKLYEALVSFRFLIVDTKGYDMAQVCAGGISLNDIDLSFESKIIPGLYFTGEVMDVSGDCGGYNLGFAFLSGIIAGKSIGDICD